MVNRPLGAQAASRAGVSTGAGASAALGSLARYLATFAIAGIPGLDVLWATGLINVVGSFAIGLFATLTGSDGRLLVGSLGRQFVMSGVCGGFTTFSLASLDTFLLVADDDFEGAGLYLGLTIGFSLVAVWIGHLVAVYMNR